MEENAEHHEMLRLHYDPPDLGEGESGNGLDIPVPEVKKKPTQEEMNIFHSKLNEVAAKARKDRVGFFVIYFFVAVAEFWVCNEYIFQRCSLIATT